MDALEDLANEIYRQDQIHPQGYPFNRNGVRLGIAALDDETGEVYDEWKMHKHNVGNAASNIRTELLQVAAIAMRMIRGIDDP